MADLSIQTEESVSVRIVYASAAIIADNHNESFRRNARTYALHDDMLTRSIVINGLCGGHGLQNGERSIAEIMPSHVSTTMLSPPPIYPTGLQSPNPEIFWPISISMAIDIQFDIGKTRSVDISQESDCAEILQNLETAGWFIVKNATCVDANTHQSQLENNAVRKI